ncbi:MAG: response regulator [Ruminococcus sp.]|nr:response regulator [Ruminococcus sp.]
MLIFSIDDEKPLLRSAERVIGEAVPGSKILSFSDAADALDAVINDNIVPDVVFSDIEMPGMTGIELALKLKAVAPDVRVIFVTAYSEYAIEAFKVHAHGYLMKPLTTQAVSDELKALDLPYTSDPDKLSIRCFGHFEVFWKNEPLFFQRKQTKELLAFLVDREGAACSAEDIITALWNEEDDKSACKQRLRNLMSDLRSTLKSIGMDKILIRGRQQMALRCDAVDCDYYRLLQKDISAVNSYRGAYMIDYPWAEMAAAKIV